MIKNINFHENPIAILYFILIFSLKFIISDKGFKSVLRNISTIQASPEIEFILSAFCLPSNFRISVFIVPKNVYLKVVYGRQTSVEASYWKI